MKNKVDEFYKNGFVVFENVIVKYDLKKIQNTIKIYLTKNIKQSMPDKIKWKKIETKIIYLDL